MAIKEYYTTGETARLLKIAQATVSRMFDRSVLYGKHNPLTGKRLISRDSITAIMKRTHHPSYGLLIDKKILIGSADERLSSLVRGAFQGDDRVQIRQAEFGGDVLIQCSKEPPGLLVIDEAISGITCAQVLQSLRQIEDLTNLKILCWANAENGDRCLTWGADGVLKKEDRDVQDLKTKGFNLLGMVEEHPKTADRYEHQRRWPRASVDLSAKIWIYRVRKAHVREEGEATVDNISMGGAHLSKIRLVKGSIPSEPFKILVEIGQEPLRQWRVHCRLVRLGSNGTLEAGVQFIRLSKSKQRMLAALFESQAASRAMGQNQEKRTL
jgi:hypothetical protein